MNYAYIRVSTNLQTTENQKIVIKNYCRYHRIHNLIFISENVSGTKDPSKRKLGDLINTVQSGDLIVITELSRLGRSLMMILDTLQYLLNKGVKVIAIKEGYELGDNVQSKVLAFAFGLSAEIERTLISERTKAGLMRARAEGKQIGRRKGQIPRLKLDGRENEIIRLRKQNVSKSKCAILLNVSRITLLKYMRCKGIN